jgi:hypothetical protein
MPPMLMLIFAKKFNPNMSYGHAIGTRIPLLKP